MKVLRTKKEAKRETDLMNDIERYFASMKHVPIDAMEALGEAVNIALNSPSVKSNPEPMSSSQKRMLMLAFDRGFNK